MVTILTKNYSQEAEGDEKAEVLVSFFPHFLTTDIAISARNTHIKMEINGNKLGELPRQEAGQEDR